MDANSEYILIVFNTCTQKYEEVTVSAEVYRTYTVVRLELPYSK